MMVPMFGVLFPDMSPCVAHDFPRFSMDIFWSSKVHTMSMSQFHLRPENVGMLKNGDVHVFFPEIFPYADHMLMIFQLEIIGTYQEPLPYTEVS